MRFFRTFRCADLWFWLSFEKENCALLWATASTSCTSFSFVATFLLKTKALWRWRLCDVAGFMTLRALWCCTFYLSRCYRRALSSCSSIDFFISSFQSSSTFQCGLWRATTPAKLNCGKCFVELSALFFAILWFVFSLKTWRSPL